MYSWILIVLVCLLIVGLMVLGSNTEEGFVTVNSDSALAQRQLLQFEGERRYNTLARVQNPASHPSSDMVNESINMLIPTETNSTKNQLTMTPSSRGLGAADDGTNKQGTWVEQTGKVQAKIDFCESLPVNCDFSDPRMAECGFCHKGGVNSKGKPWRGGMYVSSDDQIRANQANKDANPNNNIFGPSAIYAPTVGTCPPKNFTLIKETCDARENALQCETAAGPASGNSCAQCYGNAGPLLYVGAKPRSFQAVLHMSHPGVYNGGVIKSGNTTINLIPSTKKLLDPQQYPLKLSEGDNITIKLAGPPSVWCAWLSSPDGKRTVSLNIGVQSITPAALGVIGDKLSLKVAKAFSGETGFSAFKAIVPNSVLWYGRNNKLPGIVVSAKYGVSIGNSVSVLESVRQLAGSGQSITVSPQQLGVTDPSPNNTKQLWIKMDTGTNYIGTDGDVLESRLFKSVLSISVTCPATLVDPTYDFDVDACPSGPMIFTEVGAGIMGSNSCYKPDGTFNPSMYCIQELFTGAGGNQNGTLWPDTNEKLAAVIQKVNGVPDIGATSVFLNNLGNIATYAQDQNGASVSFDIYLDASMKMLGTAPKNLCDGPNAGTGPHSPQCLDFLWKTSGSSSTDPVTTYNFCGRAGLLAPLNTDGTQNDDNIARANDKGSVAAVRSYYKSIFDAAQDTSNFPKWMKSMANCYNTNVGPAPPPPAANCPAAPTWDITTSRLAGYVDIPVGNYTLNFGITVKGAVGGWASIIHVTKGGNCCDVGQRSPAIWLWPNETRLHVRIGSTQDGNWGIDTDPLPIGQKVIFNLTTSGSQVKLSVNGKSYDQTQPGQRPTGTGFQIWMNDLKLAGHTVANATIESLSYIVDGQKINVLQTGSVASAYPKDLGCWKDAPDRVLTGPYGGWGHSPESCMDLANRNGQTYSAIQAGSECYTGNSGYDRLGRADGDCPTTGGPWKARTMQVKPANISYPLDLGCWKDDPDRVLKGPYGGWGHSPESCKDLASRNGQKYYSLQAGSECYTGNSGYDRMGRASGDCPPGGNGWIAHTWQLKA